MSDFFKGIEPVPFKGPDSADPMAFRFYEPDRMVMGKRMEDQLRLAVAYWHSFAWPGGDPFGGATFERPWFDNGMAAAKLKAEVAFEMFTILGAKFFTFHDRDIAPEGKSLGEFEPQRPRDRGLFRPADGGDRDRVLWGTANLFSNRRFMAGAATNPDPDVSPIPRRAGGRMVRVHAVDPAGQLVAHYQQPLRRRRRQQSRDALDRHVMLPQSRRLWLGTSDCGRRQRRRRAPALRLSHVALPRGFRRFCQFGSRPPLPEPVGIVGEHAALDLCQHIAHQAVSAWRFAGAAVANGADPKMRWFRPTRHRLRPPGMPDQRRHGGEQRRRHVVGRTRRGLGGGADPLGPPQPEYGLR